MEALPSKR
jgi:hypothetical protein